MILDSGRIVSQDGKRALGTVQGGGVRFRDIVVTQEEIKEVLDSLSGKVSPPVKASSSVSEDEE